MRIFLKQMLFVQVPKAGLWKIHWQQGWVLAIETSVWVLVMYLKYTVGYISYVDSKIDIAINVWKKLLIIDPNNQEVKEYLNKYSKKGAQPAGNVPEVTTPQQESQPARVAPKPEAKKPEVPVKPSANEDDENEDEDDEEEEE